MIALKPNRTLTSLFKKTPDFVSSAYHALVAGASLASIFCLSVLPAQAQNYTYERTGKLLEPKLHLRANGEVAGTNAGADHYLDVLELNLSATLDIGETRSTLKQVAKGLALS